MLKKLSLGYDDRFGHLARVAGLLMLSASIYSPSVFAQAEIYRCEGESGVPLYQNAPGKNCKKLDLAPLTSVPAPRLPAAATKASVSSNGAAASAAATNGFPRIEPAVQQQRDGDKRRILEDELRKEEARLAELRRDFNNGEPERRSDERNAEKYQARTQKMREDLARTEANVGSLRRELGMIRG